MVSNNLYLQTSEEGKEKSLTHHLSQSQELAKEIQRQDKAGANTFNKYHFYLPLTFFLFQFQYFVKRRGNWIEKHENLIDFLVNKIHSLHSFFFDPTFPPFSISCFLMLCRIIPASSIPTGNLPLTLWAKFPLCKYPAGKVRILEKC